MTAAAARSERAAGAGGRGGSRPARPRILLTMGDPAGVGPEVALRALLDPALRSEADLAVVGPRAVLERWAGRLAISIEAEIVDTGGDAPDTPGSPTPAGAEAALAAVVAAVQACREGAADAVVTAPVTKATIVAAGHDFPGHTEFLARLTGAGTVVMTFVHGARRVGLATNHLPISAVAGSITTTLVLDKLLTLAVGLDEWLGVASPRIAVAALNPHAGERGAIGSEETTVIAPAVAAARAAGVDAEGPHPADAVLPLLGEAGSVRGYDALLAMYHDQATIPVRLWGISGGVNLTLGLPIVRTSPDHGTAADIAGRGIADPGSMVAAARLARGIAARRLARAAEGR